MHTSIEHRTYHTLISNLATLTTGCSGACQNDTSRESTCSFPPGPTFTVSNGCPTSKPDSPEREKSGVQRSFAVCRMGLISFDHKSSDFIPMRHDVHVSLTTSQTRNKALDAFRGAFSCFGWCSSARLSHFHYAPLQSAPSPSQHN